jgi:hypothetical protein
MELTLEKIQEKRTSFIYDTSKYNFYRKIQEIFDVSCNLELIHESLPESKTLDQVTFENDTSTLFHKRYYKSPLYPEIVEIYSKFVREVIVPLFPNEKTLIVQTAPSFRIHFPNNTALGKREDQDDNEIIGLHCDGDYGHPPEEMNFMLSITGQADTNSCYIESLPGKGDYEPLAVRKGEVLVFYGNRCRHYNMKNKTNNTRISFDFRVIPGSQFKLSDAAAIHSKKRFIVGEYYSEFQFSN